MEMKICLALMICATAVMATGHGFEAPQDLQSVENEVRKVAAEISTMHHASGDAALDAQVIHMSASQLPTGPCQRLHQHWSPIRPLCPCSSYGLSYRLLHKISSSDHLFCNRPLVMIAMLSWTTQRKHTGRRTQ